MAKETDKKVAPIISAPMVSPTTKYFRCAICEQKYDTAHFDVVDERDCPLCDNKNCAKRIF